VKSLFQVLRVKRWVARPELAWHDPQDNNGSMRGVGVVLCQLCAEHGLKSSLPEKIVQLNKEIY
jgi:hypothetical protein